MGNNSIALVLESNRNSPLILSIVDSTPYQLIWHNSSYKNDARFLPTSPLPYTILFESTMPNKKIGKYSRIAFVDFLETIVSDLQRKIISNGLNQLRITSSTWSLANDLLNSSTIVERGYRAFIPTSLVSRKALMHDVDTNLSPLIISNRLETEIRDSIISIRRRTINKSEVSNMLEFVFSGVSFPSSLIFQAFYLNFPS